MKKRYITKDTSGAFFDPHRAIVPIMKRHSGCTELIGTGFFISKFGHFATAKHVLFQRDRFDPEPGLHILHFVEGDGEHEKLLVREITRISFSEMINDNYFSSVTTIKIPVFVFLQPLYFINNILAK
ncbi:MAG: hypothetical protein KAT52_04855 [Desulfobacterales bacterium]|nr:hypothetical protein [Desulfobacterales bacterium]